MRRTLRTVLALIGAIFILPGLAHMAVWTVTDRPASWREADWRSSGLLPAPKPDDAAIYVMAARTGGLKGAFSVHSWLVLKKPGAASYDRYDVVGWGSPIRRNNWSADGRWYSNEPEIHHAVHGEEARRLIPEIERAIAAYPWRARGDYTTWPGPNSNTFVASILRQVDGLRTSLPPTAVGRDFPWDGNWVRRDRDGGLHISAGGYAGIAIGGEAGFELNFLGLVAGLDPAAGQIKIPAFGSVSLLKAPDA